jgi:predicted TIM-barrel fold metal-dependent hydrolase
MLGDWIVADAVIHGFNFSEENWAAPETAELLTGSGRANAVRSDDDASRLGPGGRFRNWQPEDLEEVCFLESGIDLVAYHGVPLWYHFKDGVSDYRKGLTLRERSPGRVLVYGPVNPREGRKAWDEMRRLVEEDGVDGIKVYGADYQPGGRVYPILLNDREFGLPLIEKAIDLGVKVIAAHKMLPPIGPFAAYGVQDIADPAGLYPEMNFEIIHSGMAFVEDTAMLAFHPNVWFTMESTAVFVQKMPRRFAHFVGAILDNGGSDRLMFASGTTLVHPRPLIDAIAAFEMPEDLRRDHGYPVFDDIAKEKVLGLNFMRLHGIDPADARKTATTDHWSGRQATPLPAPWSQIRARLPQEQI